MTYREKYQQLHPEQDVVGIHVKFCPDLLLEHVPGFYCPFGFIPPNSDVCRACWDTEIPSTEEGGV